MVHLHEPYFLYTSHQVFYWAGAAGGAALSASMSGATVYKNVQYFMSVVGQAEVYSKMWFVSVCI